jgi:replicative DNA helicase
MELVTEYNNYDLNYRDKIEEQILCTLISGTPELGFQEIVMKHNLLVSDFRLKQNQDIFCSILDCYDKGAVVSPTTIVHFRPQEYRFNNSITFDHMIANLITRALFSQHTLYNDIFILKQYVIMEFWNRIGIDILHGNWNGRDVLQVSENIIEQWKNLYSRMTDGVTIKAQGSYEEEMIEKVRRKALGLSSAISTSIDIVDDFMEGYSNGELIIIAARPGMGKTTVALISSWKSYRLHGNSFIFFSLEMPKTQLKNKIISLETGIDYKKIKSGLLTEDELKRVLECNRMIENSTFFIIDDKRNIEDIQECTKEYVAKYGVKAIVIDYLQRSGVRQKDKKIREVITDISRTCKSIAVDNNIPVIALSQLNRGVESRSNKRPLLSDLKESGSIEEDADIVIFLYRDAYYVLAEGGQVNDTQMFWVEFIFAKGRDLGTTTKHLDINPITMIIGEYKGKDLGLKTAIGQSQAPIKIAGVEFKNIEDGITIVPEAPKVSNDPTAEQFELKIQ